MTLLANYGRSVAIAGVGMSDIGRKTGVQRVRLLAAAGDAPADAGPTSDDIDGLSTYPGETEIWPGMSSLGLFDWDVPIHGALCIVLSELEAARDCRKPLQRFEAFGADGNIRIDGKCLCIPAADTSPARARTAALCGVDDGALAGAMLLTRN